jgi:hypothetical protein
MTRNLFEDNVESRSITRILEEAALINVSISTFGNYRKDEVGDSNGGDPEMLHVSKKLLPPNALRPIEAIRGKVASDLNHYSLPFPLPGIRFVPREHIEEVNNRLRAWCDQFWFEVDQLVANYREVIQIARERLQYRFDPAQYPSQESIRSKFGYTWQFVNIQMPQSLSQINQELYAEQQREFDAQMDTFKNEAMTALRESFLSLIDRMVKVTTTSGKSRQSPIRESLVEDFNRFFETFSALNIGNDTELASLVQVCRERMSGVDMNEARRSVAMRERMNESFVELQQTFEARFNVDIPTRKIRRMSQNTTLADEEADNS